MYYKGLKERIINIILQEEAKHCKKMAYLFLLIPLTTDSIFTSNKEDDRSSVFGSPPHGHDPVTRDNSETIRKITVKSISYCLTETAIVDEYCFGYT